VKGERWKVEGERLKGMRKEDRGKRKGQRQLWKVEGER